MGTRESSPPIQPPDEMFASFACSTNISNRSVSPLQFRSNDSLTPVLEEDCLKKIHIDVSTQIITEQMLIEIYKENHDIRLTKQNHNIPVVNNQKISSNQDKENISPSNICLPNKFASSRQTQSLLNFIFNGLGT